MEWQPIETAPDESAEVLIYTKHGGMYVVTAGWLENGSIVWIGGGPGIRDATHWMPLPPPPQVQP